MQLRSSYSPFIWGGKAELLLRGAVSLCRLLRPSLLLGLLLVLEAQEGLVSYIGPPQHHSLDPLRGAIWVWQSQHRGAIARVCTKIQPNFWRGHWGILSMGGGAPALDWIFICLASNH